MKKQHFLQGAAILGAAGIISKLLGAFYRIPFARMVGGEGMGIYQMAYPIYTLALALSTSGLPTALAVMISQRSARNEHQAARKIFRVAFIILSVSGAVMSFAIIKFAPFLAANIFHHPASVFAIRAVAPAIFISAVVSCWRGYFQGYQNMLPTAVSQIAEQLVRVVTVLALAFYLIPFGAAYAAAGAAFGAVTGGVAAVAVLGVFAAAAPIFSGNKSDLTSKEIVTDLFRLGVPVALSGLIMPIVQGIDAVVIPGRLLAAGYSNTEAANLYGQLTGMAMTLVNLPVMFTVALATGIVPAVSEAFALGNAEKAQKTIQSSFTALLLVSVPSAIGLHILSNPICKLLYNLPETGEILKVASLIVIAIGTYQVSASVLQGMGKMFITLINLCIGCSVKILCTYLLVAVPSIGIFGAVYSTAGGFIFAAGLNIIFLAAVLGREIFRIPLLRIALANVLLAFICNVFYNQLAIYHEVLLVSGVVISAIIAYFAIIIIFDIISLKDFKNILAGFRRK